MSERWFTEKHEWLEVDAGLVTLGITDFAQSQLGDIVFVELPEVGVAVTAGEDVIVIESVKAAGEVSSPLSGVVEEVNEVLADAPDTINEDPLASGWMIKLRTDGAPDVSGFMDEAAYATFIEDH